MERLTEQTPGGVVLCGKSIEDMQAAAGRALNRLADYEDIGMEPREIMAMMAENQRLHKENFWLTGEGAAERRQSRPPKWTAMGDAHPPEDGSYIVCTKYGAVCTAHYNKKTGRFGDTQYGVTHWRALPEPPEGRERG